MPVADASIDDYDTVLMPDGEAEYGADVIAAGQRDVCQVQPSDVG